jgi:C4-dicarboxylate transporter DctM subunit
MGVAKASLPFIISFLIALALITYVPWFSTFLVSLL